MLVCLGALLLTIAWSAIAGNGWPPEPWQVCSLEGAWNIVSPDLAPGEILVGLYGAEDPKTGRASFLGRHANGDVSLGGMFPDAESGTSWFGTSIRTLPDTTQLTAVAYAMQDVKPRAVVTWIWVLNHTTTAIDADSSEWNGAISIYSANLPDQDKDDDGRPDEGEEPILCIPVSGTAHRLGPMPPCEPTPMPGQ